MQSRISDYSETSEEKDDSKPCSSASVIKTEEELEAENQRKRKAKELYSDLAKEISEDSENYLDINLEDDLVFLNKYYSLLSA